MPINMIKLAFKIGCALALLYILIVIGFEAGLRILQPTWNGTLVLTTTDQSGDKRERVISGLYYQKTLYIRANHWPREWYYEALEQPKVMIDRGGGAKAYTAVPVSGEEEKRVNAKNGIPFKFRFLTGFPRLKLLRLDPVHG